MTISFSCLGRPTVSHLWPTAQRLGTGLFSKTRDGLLVIWFVHLFRSRPCSFYFTQWNQCQGCKFRSVTFATSCWLVKWGLVVPIFSKVGLETFSLIVPSYICQLISVGQYRLFLVETVVRHRGETRKKLIGQHVWM